MSDDRYTWDEDYWFDADREARWDRADNTERIEELEVDRLQRDLGECGPGSPHHVGGKAPA